MEKETALVMLDDRLGCSTISSALIKEHASGSEEFSTHKAAQVLQTILLMLSCY